MTVRDWILSFSNRLASPSPLFHEVFPAVLHPRYVKIAKTIVIRKDGHLNEF